MSRSNSNYSYTLDNEILGVPFTGVEDIDLSDPRLDKISMHLPLKANMVDVSDDWDSSFPETPSTGFGSSAGDSLTASMTNLNLNLNMVSAKKVRFDENSTLLLNEEENHYNYQLHKPMAFSTNNTKKTRDVEDLIQSASSMNHFVEENIGKINDFRNHLYNNGLYNNNSNTKKNDIYLRSHIGSISNFELSDSETIPTEDTLHYDIQDNIDFNSTFNSNDEENKNDNINSIQEEMNRNIKKYAELKQVPKDDGLYESHLENQPYKFDPSNLTQINKVTIDEAIKYFTITIETLLQLSQNLNNESLNKINLENMHSDLSSFKMKSIPSVSYKDLITRIQKKCEFEPIIFLQSTYLLQTLLINRPEVGTKEIHLKNKLELHHIHRLIIAVVRISCKLLQDKQYSHEYFSKVCGITKRLLTKLEVSLMIAVRDNELMCRNRDILAALSTVTMLENTCNK
ncbi:similar to Saccharomyces cerevisiae YGL134W PCL10 Pho85p cyclin [Maudiozyma saulgeensis]|uniref:Similar to Saccharomyces cerevisiae YGL134W PCL10 Pho85p cyclin n=1 Tax=Maudiozyma saulgeensis TaxID=1789683 RepID=A0A1X7R0R1_9SACH|nr:similar to Saccharomyces cerevisiae YGL134W PCL10 Pho85p cyclin [Kazachstania saulgeensis]